MEPPLSILVTLIRTIIVNKDITFMQRCLVTTEKQAIDKIRTVWELLRKRDGTDFQRVRQRGPSTHV
jgi:hypothetical protein